MIKSFLCSCILIIGLLGISPLVLSYVTLFRAVQNDLETQQAHDLFTWHEICRNDFVRTSMGSNSAFCQDIESRVQSNPRVEALRAVLHQSCQYGSQSCFAYIMEGFASLERRVTVALILLILTWIPYFCKRRRKSYYTQKLDYALPFSQLDFDQQYFLSIPREEYRTYY
jgi:hypothetical protein